MKQRNVLENKKKIVEKIRLIKDKLIANQKRYNKHSTHRQTVTVIIILVLSKSFFFRFSNRCFHCGPSEVCRVCRAFLFALSPCLSLALDRMSEPLPV